MNALTAGHPTLPLPPYAYVTNLKNGHTILVRINDHGPYVNDRIIDLSRRTAREPGFLGHSLARVRVRYASPAPLNGNDIAERRYLAAQPWHRARRRLAKGTVEGSKNGIAEPIVTASPWTITRNRNNQMASAGHVFATRRASLGGPPRFYVSASVFPSRAQDERLRHELKGPGPIEVEQLNLGPKPLFRVQLGPFDDVQAQATAAQVALLGITSSVHILD